MLVKLVRYSKILPDATLPFRRVGGGGSRGSKEPPWQVNDEGLKTQAVNFQLLANSGG